MKPPRMTWTFPFKTANTFLVSFPPNVYLTNVVYSGLTILGTHASGPRNRSSPSRTWGPISRLMLSHVWASLACPGVSTVSTWKAILAPSPVRCPRFLSRAWCITTGPTPRTTWSTWMSSSNHWALSIFLICRHNTLGGADLCARLFN